MMQWRLTITDNYTWGRKIATIIGHISPHKQSLVQIKWIIYEDMYENIVLLLMA